jgi:signal recognition particle receptor subunit beta
MDMGKLKIGDDIEVHLFSTPGQERFDFMFDILSKGILGAIILVDATSEESIAVAENLAKKIRERFDIPILYAVTKLDMPNAKSLEEIKAFLSSIEGVSVEPLDPRDKESGKEVLVKLLSMMV